MTPAPRKLNANGFQIKPDELLTVFIIYSEKKRRKMEALALLAVSKPNVWKAIVEFIMLVHENININVEHTWPQPDSLTGYLININEAKFEFEVSSIILPEKNVYTLNDISKGTLTPMLTNRISNTLMNLH